MRTQEGLIDRIYEAAVLPERWPALLDAIGGDAGARGGLIFSTGPDGTRLLGSPDALAMASDFVAEGWMAQNDRVPRLIARRHPGFQTDRDFYSDEEVRTLPIFAEFLIPRGWIAAAATSIRGAGEDNLCLSVEGFPDHEIAADAIPALDRLRPHLARAAMFASQLRLEQARAAVATLDMIGVPGAVLSDRGTLLAANGRLEALVGDVLLDRRLGVQLVNKAADVQLQATLAAMRSGGRDGRSLPLPSHDGGPPRIVHVLPVAGAARDIFTRASAIVVFTSGAVAPAFGIDLLQGLFDLTPAEARIARELAEGRASAEIAAAHDRSLYTVRTQVKSVLEKVGVGRQSDLVKLLTSLALPA